MHRFIAIGWTKLEISSGKRQNWAKIDLTSVTLTFDLWPWAFARTSLLPNPIGSESFMMIRWWEPSEKGVTDGQTDGQTDCASHIAAWSQLKSSHALRPLLRNPLAATPLQCNMRSTKVFSRISKPWKSKFVWNFSSVKPISTIFCTGHRSTTLVPSTKFHDEWIYIGWDMRENTFPQLWNKVKKLDVKHEPVCNGYYHRAT